MLATSQDAPMVVSTINVDELLKSTGRSIQVEKEVPLTIDVGNLTAFDMAPVEMATLGQGKARDAFLLKLTRENTQLLFNSLFSLPTSTVEKVKCVQLPAPTTKLPREKPIPKPKLPTKWEAFAKSKGILKKKRGRMLFDEAAKEWKPRFGYNKAGGDKEQNWVVEVPGNGDPYKDWLGDKEDKTKEKVAKNEFQRLANISKQVKIQSESINQTVKQANISTASLGKFQEKSKDEKKAKSKGKHKKFDPVSGNTASEKEKSLALINKIASGGVSVNKEKAANKELGATIKRSREAERENRTNKRRSKMGVKAQTNHFDMKKREVSGPGKDKKKREVSGGPEKERKKRHQ